MPNRPATDDRRRRHRSEERFAEEVLRRVLGIDVTQRDDESSTRMVDALFDLPDGRAGALEVTTIGEREALERQAIAANEHWHVKGARWAWRVHVGPGVVMRELKRHLPTLVLTCERLGVEDPRRVRNEGRSAAFEWLDASNVSMNGVLRTKRPGAIDVLPKGGGGAEFENLEELPKWLSERLRGVDLTNKVEKLRATGREELHLFLRIHDTAMPFSLYHPLAFREYVPPSPLDAPIGLTGLWLAPRWKNPILWWGLSTGWRREHCLD